MIICPQCLFENFHTHQSCRECGTPLTHYLCEQCGAPVPFAENDCPECENLTAKVLRAVIYSSDRPVQDLACQEGYLDIGQRYRLVGASEAPNFGFQVLSTPGGRRLLVGEAIDCRPFEHSALGVLLDRQDDLFDRRETEEKGVNDLWQQLKIPALAYPYLQLKEFIPILPAVHDAWQADDWEVLLLPDRSPWLSLVELIQQGQSPRLQTLYWLNEMAVLWKVLKPHGYQQSILQADNLKIDEDRTLGLCQLYPNAHTKPPSLEDLALFWQKHLLPSVMESDTFEILSGLCNRLMSGAIATFDDLSSQLQELADAEQTANSELSSEIEPVLSEILMEELADNLDNPDSDPCDSVTTVPKVSEPATAFLPMELLSFEEFGTTDRGRQRYHNEDYFGIYSQCQRQQTSQYCKLEGQGLYIICDGMGGHASGEVASALAVEALHQYFLDCGLNNFPTADTIRQGIWQANQKLYLINQQNASMGSGRMGTTLVMMSIDNTKVAIAHVGDSRIYRVTRKWGLEKLTVDHEVGQKAIQSGLDPIAAYSRPDAYQLTQALGPLDEECVQPDVRFLELQEDTLFLLCSDGLSDNNLVEGNWEELLLPLLSFQISLETAMKKLIDFANQHNGHDNISAILVRLKVRPTPNR